MSAVLWAKGLPQGLDRPWDIVKLLQSCSFLELCKNLYHHEKLKELWLILSAVE